MGYMYLCDNIGPVLVYLPSGIFDLLVTCIYTCIYLYPSVEGRGKIQTALMELTAGPKVHNKSEYSVLRVAMMYALLKE